MKEYDRETKSWVDKEEVERKLKKRKLCKGGKEHDYILILPWHVEYPHSSLGIDVAEHYYFIEEEINEFLTKKDKELEAIGIKRRHVRVVYKTYICSVCGKRDCN